MKNNKGKSDSSKYWATIVYYEHYQDIKQLDKDVKSMHICCAISPLHDKDTKEHKDVICGREYTSLRLKKAHYHILFKFDNAISENSFKYLLEHHLKEKSYFECILIRSFNGYARYLCHLDDLDKFQYKTSDILYYRLNECILESPKLDELDKLNEMLFFIELINKFEIEDTHSLYECVSRLFPDKLLTMVRYINTLEKFTRGMYQSNLRKERLRTITTTK